MRRPTKRDAKKDALLPGVTDVLDVIAKPGLTNWLIRQPLIAATKSADLDSMRKHNAEGWIKCITDRADEEKSKAPDLGSKIHNGIERYLKWIMSKKQAVFHLDDDIKGYLRVFKDWFEARDITIRDLEKCVANTDVGYGGKLDFRGTWDGKPCYIDWKTTKFRKGKATYYPSWKCQLAAYAVADNGGVMPSGCLLISVAIDSAEPGLVDYKIWDNNTDAWNLFKLCMEMYKSPLGANWDPTTNGGA